MAEKETSLAVSTPPGEYKIATMDQKALPIMLRDNCGVGGIDQFEMDRVSMPAGGGQQWSVPTLEGEENPATIEGVCVLFQDGRAYWEKSFEETGGGAPPDCQSTDGGLTGVGDRSGCGEKTTQACAACPLAEFGSGKGNAQACKSQRLLYLLRPDNILPLIIALSPGSLKGVKKFFVRLTAAGIAYYGCVIRVGLEKTQNAEGVKYSRATFAMIGRMTPEETEKFKGFNEVFKEIFAGAAVVTQSDENDAF